MIQKVHDDKFIVVRKNCLMEDEGNWHVLAICDTRQEVAEFCKDFTDRGEGYFHMGNMIYIGSHFSSAGGRVSDELQLFLPENIREYLNK